MTFLSAPKEVLTTLGNTKVIQPWPPRRDCSQSGEAGEVRINTGPSGNTVAEAQSRRLLLLEGGFHFFFFSFSFSGQYCIHIAQNLKGTAGYTPERFPSILPLATRSFSQRQPELQVLECLFRPVLCIIQTNTQRAPFFYMKSSTLALFSVCDRSLSIRKSFLLSFTTGEYSIVRMYFYLASALWMDM